MKPGALVGLVVPGGTDVYLGTLDQPVIVGGERRWSVSWSDGTKDSGTWPEEWIRTVVA